MTTTDRPIAPQLFLGAGILGAIGLSSLVAVHAGYYLLPVAERPLHAAHELLRPSGKVGLSLGIAGTVLMLLNLTYLLRKKLARLRGVGSLRSWMAFHVATGLLGPGLIVAHSAFAPKSTHGTVAFVAMLVVVTTGVIGRWLYARVPRSIEGHELEYEELRRRLTRHRDVLLRLGVAETLLRPVRRFDPTEAERSLVGAIACLIAGDRAFRRDLDHLRRAVQASATLRRRAKEILPVATELCRERHWLVRYQELRFAMSSWRFLHRWLAIVMLVVAAGHIVLALRFGALWVLTGS